MQDLQDQYFFPRSDLADHPLMHDGVAQIVHTRHHQYACIYVLTRSAGFQFGRSILLMQHGPPEMRD
jgi:hypothetical protein